MPEEQRARRPKRSSTRVSGPRYCGARVRVQDFYVSDKQHCVCNCRRHLKTHYFQSAYFSPRAPIQLWSGASIPIHRWRQMRRGQFWGEWTKKLFKHVLYLLYSLPIIFSKNFLTRYACSIAFYPQLTNASIQCVLPTAFIYIFFIFWCHYPWLPASIVHWKHA